ncbi:hypothetical protein [Desulfocurvibacter africanus]|uniref:hypothetical protein n=1 Tax=Desulfocurvibacter africanus TaxID=873 RepID=UPI000488A2E9|nr:hypothetical protein [Desulfocurvibacter africanus]
MRQGTCERRVRFFEEYGLCGDGAFTGGVFSTRQKDEAFIREIMPGIGRYRCMIYPSPLARI